MKRTRAEKTHCIKCGKLTTVKRWLFNECRDCERERKVKEAWDKEVAEN